MRPQTKRLADCLSRLSAALATLDHKAVDQCVAELEEQAAVLPRETICANDLAVLGFRLRAASELAGSAAGLYEGWTRVVSPPPASYAPDGKECAPVRRASMDLDG